MKKALVLLLAVLVGGVVFHWKQFSGWQAQLEKERAAWAAEKAGLEAQLAEAKQIAPPPPTIIEKEKLVPMPADIDPREIITQLQSIRIAQGSGQSRNIRIVIQHLENLIACGPRALEPIREFLHLNQEVNYESWMSPRPSRDGRISTSFVLPPSLRFGLFDAVRRIGGEEGEQLLVEILDVTGRGAEVAYLARVLQEMAPDKYRERAVYAARELLSNPPPENSGGLDRYDREYLYGVLSFFGDTSYASEAHAQLAMADGSINAGALRYLQQTLGEQALPMIYQHYQNPNLNASGKERLGRFALNFAGANPQADALWSTAVLDPAVPLRNRDDLIEDLAEDGFENRRNPTERDLAIAKNRLALIEKYRSSADHERIAGAFAEAQRDLQRILERSSNNQSRTRRR